MNPLYLHGVRLLDRPSPAPDTAVLIQNGQIVALGSTAELPCPADAEPFEAAGLWLAPGFIDLQVNGAFGLDFTTAPETIWEVGAGLLRYGVTAFLPTIVTSPLETVAAAQRVLRAGPPPGYVGAEPLGLHLEGPFLNPAKRGAHDPALMRLPTLDDVADWSPEQGVRLVTLAPELPGALAVVEALCGRGVLVSAGHSAATYEQARAALQAGVRYGTHLFNAMSALDHRAPGLPGALLTDPNAIAGVIADGIHFHPALADLIWRAKGPAQVNLVSEAMAALGRPPGRYQLGQLEVLVDETSARLSDGRLAGSILSLDQAVRNWVKFTNCSPAEAVAAATSVPAQALLLKTHGPLRVGSPANLALLTADLHIAATVIGGKIAWRAAETLVPPPLTLPS
jgi:N-acetylglucosamine-6-phosphate deacetylase